MTTTTDQLIYDWNVVASHDIRERVRPIEFDDETLRDGLQSPSVTDPEMDEKLAILRLMNDLGIQSANVGLPGAGPRARAHVKRLCEEIRDARLAIAPNCAARTLEPDIRPIIEVSQEVGIAIEAALFIGSSPIRQYAEDWTIDRMLMHTETAVRLACEAGLPVMYVTEDTTRAHPDDLRRLYSLAIECGAKRICVCDTCGHVTPNGVHNLLQFIKQIVADTGVADIKLDWHGHRDRGLSIPNTLAAIDEGVDRVHGTALGIGERVGNTPIDLLLVNLKLMGLIDNDLRKLPEYCARVSRALGVPIPRNYPVVGEDAFETATGVHAAAVIKAYEKGDAWLADRVYSGVPAGDFGRDQNIRIGPMSGKSNVIYWLKRRGIEPTSTRVEAIFQRAKQTPHLLSDDEIQAIIHPLDAS
jgi:2-isopropylmalate synthase